MNKTNSQFVSIKTNTPVKLKAACPFKGVRKISKRNGLINVDYTMAVKRNIAKETGQDVKDVDYQAGSIWYKHVMTDDGKKLPLVQHTKTGKYYFQFFPHKSKTLQYVDSQGNSLMENQLKPYFYAKSERDEFKPAVISVDIDNIVELKARGIKFTKENLLPA